MKNQKPKPISRRDLLKKLGENGVYYTAPAVVALLSTNDTFAHGRGNPTSYMTLNDCINDPNSANMNGMTHAQMNNVINHCTNKHPI